MGAPLGNTNGIKGKRWTKAIENALAKRSKATGMEELDRLAEEFLDDVEESGVNGFKELGDRLEGRAMQRVELGNTDGEPFVIKVDASEANL